MEVLRNLFEGYPNLWGGGVAHSVLILSLTIAFGIILAKIKVRGVSLGVTWILFVGIVFGHFNMNLDEHLLHFLKEFGLILFVYSINWLFNHEQLLHIVSRAKALLPHCCVILGGPEFLGDNEAFLYKNKFVSGVFRGEGEEVFPLWLKVWNQPRKEWKSITGLCYLNESGEYQDNGLARVMNFSELVPPEKSRFFNWSKPFVQLETTRGCFNTCAFCVSGGEKPVRTLSLEAIKERLDVIHEHGIKNVRVLDRTFNYNNKRAKELLNLFREYPDICFHLEIHPALLSDELKQELATLPKGLLHLEAGIQSLRENVLEQSRRIGKLSDALAGLHYLCSLENMETHADLIAGLPLYHLSEIFDDVRTLTEYGAGEIQLESLKLLPGTEMRRRADELGIQYSPLPPYEVLQTREITVDELQTAHYLSRLLDGFYNTPTWRNITRILILENPHFIHDLLDHLVRTDVIDTPLSLERRGLILYDFCKNHYPDYLTQVSIAWIEAGMSLKKAPAEKVRTKRQLPPESWEVVYGAYRENLRLCFLPVDEEGHGYWFGFESEIQKIQPVFKARKLS